MNQYFQVFSGGRDRNIYLTDLRHSEAHLLVCRETDPVLKMVLTPEASGKADRKNHESNKKI